MSDLLESKRQYALECAELFKDSLSSEQATADSIDELLLALEQHELSIAAGLWRKLSLAREDESISNQFDGLTVAKGISNDEVRYYMLNDAMKQLRIEVEYGRKVPLWRLKPDVVHRDLLSDQKSRAALSEEARHVLPGWAARLLLVTIGGIFFALGFVAFFNHANGIERVIAYGFAILFWGAGAYLLWSAIFASRDLISKLLGKVLKGL